MSQKIVEKSKMHSGFDESLPDIKNLDIKLKSPQRQIFAWGEKKSTLPRKNLSSVKFLLTVPRMCRDVAVDFSHNGLIVLIIFLAELKLG